MDINKANRVIDNTLTDFRKGVDKSEPKLAKLLLDWVNKFNTTNGNLVSSQRNLQRLTGLDNAVKRFLIESGYVDTVSKFLQSYTPLTDAIREIHKDLSDLDIAKSYTNPYKKFAIEKATRALVGQGMSDALVLPIQEQLFLSINQGVSLQGVIKSLEATISTTQQSQGILKRTALQVSRDALGQYEGSVNQAVAQSYKLDAILYVGSLVKDSRPQCERWVNFDKNGRLGLILLSELDSEIDWAENNGTGFIEGTTISNFYENRGGYNCRHTAYPVRSSVYLKKQKN